MCVSTGADMSYASSIEQSAMYSRRGRGRGPGRDFGVAHLKLDAIFLVASKVLLTRGRGTIRTVDGVITSLRSVEKSLVDLSGHN